MTTTPANLRHKQCLAAATRKLHNFIEHVCQKQWHDTSMLQDCIVAFVITFITTMTITTVKPKAVRGWY